ncbi:MAG: oligosaccharide flippase family protein [Alphaproteobacteria bacterium]|nr:oligosaccharide flippase family protein [Alphaproteobacteria bacterium]
MADRPPPPAVGGGAVRASLVWNAANFAVSQVASAAVFFILAAQLPPAVFGVLALAIVLTDLIATQGRSAMTDAIVQSQDFSRPGLNAAFWAGMIVCAAVAAALIGFRHELAALFKAQELAAVLPPIAAALLLTPALAVMEAIVLKDLDFRTLNLRNMAGVFVSGALALAVVFSPWREWAFVVQRVTQTTVSFAFLFAATRWVPGLAADGAGVSTFARRAGPIWAVQGLNVAGARVTEMIVGFRLGASDLGVLRVAQKFFEILHGSLTSAVMAVWLPVLSRLRDDPEGARGFFLRVMSLAAMLVIPAQLGLGLVGPEITRLFLSDAYANAAPLIGLISLGALFVPMSFFRAPILVALGKSGIGVVLAIIDLVLGATAIYLFSGSGLVTAYTALVVVWFATLPISGVIICREARVPLRQFARAIQPAYEGALVMAAAVLAMRTLTAPLPAAAALAVLALTGAAAYGGYLWLVRRKDVTESIAFLRTRG